VAGRAQKEKHPVTLHVLLQSGQSPPLGRLRVFQNVLQTALLL
jgi:hypothetical protein